MNKKNLAVVSLVLSIISLVPFVWTPDSLDTAMIFCVVFVFIAIAGIICGFMGKSASKGMGIAGIVIGIIAIIVLGLSILGLAGMKSATNCVDQGNGMSKCEYMGQELEMPTSYVREDQKKK